jgi:thiol:disulfide interchange protein DsbD
MRMKIHKISLFFILLIFSWLGSVNAESTGWISEYTQARLVSEHDAIIPGGKLRVGLLLAHEPGWHTYWENPGDAGLATDLQWTLPEGFAAGNIDWPPPQRILEGPLAVYAYSDQLLLPVTIAVPPALTADQSVTLKAKASWLVCKDICIPESAELEIVLPVKHAPAPSESAELFATHDEDRPAPLAAKSTYTVSDKQLHFSLPLASLGIANITDAYFFVRASSVINYSAEQKFSANAEKISLAIPMGENTAQGNISGILAVGNDESEKYFEVALAAATPAVTPAAISKPVPVAIAADAWLPAMLLFALIGGAILNLMPCVLPVLSLKALAVVEKSGKARAHILSHGVAYTLGIMLSFAAIAGLLISLQQAGSAVGWGYQMQSPMFVGVLIYLLFLVGLNLSGLFHLPVLLGNVGGNLANEDSTRGSFFTGMLATAVATPCTAPFMASAVGVALTLPAWQAMAIFLTLGFGLALPFLLICMFPACLRLLPRPGAWMETFKQLLAFPMYASVIWLLWVLTQQTGANGMLVALAGMLAMVMVIWMKPLFVSERNYRIAALILYAAILGWSLPMLKAMPATSSIALQENEVAFSEEKIAELRGAGIGVLVDATAAWCITCQVNKRVLHSEAVRQAMRDKNITLMIADWTLRDAAISDWLKSFGYQGVPLYVYYPPSGEPKILPQILTVDNVLGAL